MNIAKQFYTPSFQVLVLCGVMCVCGSPVQAAGKGAIGPTSTGSVNLSITKTTVARISGLSDMSISLDATKSEIAWTNDVCVYSGHASANYAVKAVGSSKSEGAFVMANGEKTLTYNVTWDAGGVGGLSSTSLAPNIPSAILSKVTRCHGVSGGAMARLVVNITRSALQLASGGSYADSLILGVSPS